MPAFVTVMGVPLEFGEMVRLTPLPAIRLAPAATDTLPVRLAPKRKLPLLRNVLAKSPTPAHVQSVPPMVKVGKLVKALSISPDP